MKISREEKPGDGFTAFSTGEQIRALRVGLDITQTEFGAMLGVTKQSIWNWETGVYRPSVSARQAMLEIREMYSKQPE